MRIDAHVHVVGNGLRGSGCWYRPRGWTKFGQPIMLKAFGLPASALTEDLETLYAERLVAMLRASSLDAAVILGQDLPYAEDGTPLTEAGSFYVPNDYLFSLARTYRELLPAVSIHPARPDAMDELERCLSSGAVVLKCLPNCQNIDWNNPRYTKFLERMAEAGLPLLAHTGSERTLPVVAPQLADPRVLTRALEIGVTCIAAHLGTGISLLDPVYVDTWIEMTRKFPRLYGDNSALACMNFRFWPRHLRRCLEPEVAARILHGSDLPVLVDGTLAWMSGMITWKDYRAAANHDNPIERDVMLKRAMGFPEETFTRAASVLRLKN